MGYECFQGDGNAASLLLTNFDNGDSLGICGEHVADWALSLLCAVTGTIWVPETDTATEPETGDATDEPETAEGPTVPAPGIVTAPLPGDDQDDDDDQGDDDDDDELSDDYEGEDQDVPARARASADA